MQRLTVLLLTHTDKQSMRQDFSEQPRAEMPTISRPNALDGKLFGELPDDGFNPAAQIRHRAGQPKLLTTCLAERSNQFQAASPSKLKQARRPVISIAQAEAARLFEQIFSNGRGPTIKALI